MFNDYSFGENTQINIGMFLLSQTGTYQEQKVRPFNVVVNDNTISRLEIETHGGKHLGIAAMQNIATDIIRPAAMAEGDINIAQGWRSRRFRFLMRVHERHTLGIGTESVRVLFGYTDHCDASINHLDPNMRIYFNSETVLAETIRSTAQGPVRVMQVVSANQIISPVDYQANQNGFHNRPTSHLIRPEDVFQMGQALNTVEMLKHTRQIANEHHQVFVSPSMVGQGGEYRYSKRRDTSPTRYMADVLGAWQHSIKEAEVNSYEARANPDLLMGEASRITANHDLRSNTFIQRLRERAGYMERGYVTYGDLCRLFPEAAQCGPGKTTMFSMDNGQSIRKVNFAEQSNHWQGADHETIAATLLSQVIPAIMMDNFFRNITFTVVPGAIPGTFGIDFMHDQCAMVVDNLVAKQYFDEFQRRLVVDVLNSITRNGQLPLYMSMTSDLAGESVIDISLNGNPRSLTRYVAPTFTDSLFSPVITRTAELPQQVSADLIHLVSEILPPGNNQQAAAAPSYMPTNPYGQVSDTPQFKGGVQADIETFGLL